MATTKTKTYGEDRICEGADCTTRLSRFNRDELCATCHKKIPMGNLPTRIGVYL